MAASVTKTVGATIFAFNQIAHFQNRNFLAKYFMYLRGLLKRTLVE